MAEVLIIDSDEDDHDGDIEVISSANENSIDSSIESDLFGASSNSRRKTVGKLASDLSVCVPLSPGNCSDCSSMDSPARPVRKKARTRRGIAYREADDGSGSPNVDLPREFNVPSIYTSQINLLREKKKQLNIDNNVSLFMKEVDAENICPANNVEQPVKITGRGRPRLCKKKLNELPAVVSVSNDSDVDDDILTPPPPPPVEGARRGRKTKLQIEQDALWRSLQAVRDNYEAAKRYEKENGFYDSSGVELDMDILEEDVDKEIQMKFRWRSQITRFPMKMKQRFHGILPTLSELCGVAAKQLLLSVRDIVIKPEDTPSSLRLSIVDIIDCGVAIPGTSAATDECATEADAVDPNVIRLQLQCKDQKNKVTVTIRKGELLCSMMEQYSEKQGIPLEKLIFKFDGETLSPEDTPEDLDLEDDFCIDVVVQT